MDVSPILEPLNEAQREAVSAPPEPVLVLAGAGSGKTRVLVHRAAWLMQVENISPMGLIAVTFTNKAAWEMRARIEALLGLPTAQMWVGTFHGLAHRILRRHAAEAGLDPQFQIIDAEDQLRLVRRVLKAMNLDESRYAPREVCWFINAQKDEGKRPAHVDTDGDENRSRFVQIYSAYEEACAQSALVDFGELLLRAHELWRDNADLLEHYRRRFSHLLVDEFQDTNTIQYGWLRLLAGSTAVPFVVGDDDQSIYAWRGAQVGNLQRFTKDFPNHRLIKLERNYRSTPTILKAANAVIGHNTSRLGKNLWTEGADGEPIRLYSAFNERDESQFVVNRIRDWVAQGNRRDEAAVLYRSNAQSRVFEEAFLNAGIPYRVYGGLRFFDRAEIKDALAYLRLVFNRADDSSFERVINTPLRGIGARTMDIVRARARDDKTPLWHAAADLVASGDGLARRAASAVIGFIRLIDTMARAVEGLPLHEQVDHVVQNSGLIEHFKREGSEKSEARVENLEELVSAARGFDPETDEEDELPPLAAFLAHAALESGEAQGEAWEDCVQLMTLHSAKGLEFPLVFICGMEDGLFPHQRSAGSPEGIEEERRLCYVGMTRAMKQLYISHAEQRRLHGVDNYAVPSRFIGEIPSELIEEIRPHLQIRRPVAVSRPRVRPSAPSSGMRLGQRVRHTKFGEGLILNYEGQGAHARVQVNFERAGTKWLVLAYANLEEL